MIDSIARDDLLKILEKLGYVSLLKRKAVSRDRNRDRIQHEKRRRVNEHGVAEQVEQSSPGVGEKNNVSYPCAC